MTSFIGIARRYFKSKKIPPSIKRTGTGQASRFGPRLNTHREAIVCQGNYVSGTGRPMKGRGRTKEGLGGGPSVTPNINRTLQQQVRREVAPLSSAVAVFFSPPPPPPYLIPLVV
jgi:hypothetical protein